MVERNYDFRKRIDIAHKPNRRNPDLTPGANETAVQDCWRIVVGDDASGYVVKMAEDLQNYLFVSMNVSTVLLRQKQNDKCIECAEGSIYLTQKQVSELGTDLNVPRSFRLVVAPGEITVCGFDERGIGQGCYHIEELMNLREAPFLEHTDVVREPIFSPRMIHSGWTMDQFPDSHLNSIAHAGFDTILLFVSGVNATPTAHVDINDLIERADSFGLDVYLYSYLLSERHPDDPDAEEYYESTYGKLIEAHSKAKGIIFVGESCEFPSKDTHTTGRLRLDPPPDGNPKKLPSPGWWPCYDYPDWLNLLKRVMRKHNPDLDIVFWTYNWGWAPEKDRLKLIRNLPTDISLQATFEMFEDIEKDGIMTRCADYTASFEGPGIYFRTEAETAHERGLRLYTMANTGGLTWDIGVIPYQPIPFRWNLRYQALLKANKDWGLAGLMESHHYGWWPSFVSELAKWAFWSPAVDIEEKASKIAARDFSKEAAPDVIAAWHAWSDAFADYVVTNEDQYGAFRVGPSYPFFLLSQPVNMPDVPYAHFGHQITSTGYGPHSAEDLPTEIKLLERMAQKWQVGLESLKKAIAKTPDKKLEDANRMLNLGEFILRCVRTTVNIKRWWTLKNRLSNLPEGADNTALLDEMVELISTEIENAQSTIPLVEADSRLGWEPSMEYMTDREHLEWKISLLQKILQEEIPSLRAN